MRDHSDGNHWFFLGMSAVSLALLQGGTAAVAHGVQDRVEQRQSDFRYRGDVAIDPENGRLDVDFTIEVLDASRDSVTFLLNAMVGEAEVSGAHVRSVTMAPDPRFEGFVNAYTVNLEPAGNASSRMLRFRYGGQPIPDEVPLEINSVSADHIELTVDSFWFPFDQSFQSTIDARLDIAIQGDWVGVAPGSITQTTRGFRLEQDIGSLDIAFSLLSDPVVREAGDYVVYDARTEPGGGIDEVFSALQSCSQYLNGLAGLGDALPSAQVIMTDRKEGGYSRRTMIALTDVSGDNARSTTQFVCHELAHNWSLANAAGPENWHNEGLADAIANLALRETFGTEAYAERLERYRARVRSSTDLLGPIWTGALTDRPAYIISYRAAPLAFATLEERLGSVHFRIFLRRLMNEKVATTPRMLDVLEEVAGLPWRNWFETQLGREATIWGQTDQPSQ